MIQDKTGRSPAKLVKIFPTQTRAWVNKLFNKFSSNPHSFDSSKIKLNKIKSETQQKFFNAFYNYLSKTGNTTGKERIEDLKALLAAKKQIKNELDITGDDQEKELNKVFTELVATTLETCYKGQPRQKATAIKKIQESLAIDISTLSSNDETQNFAESLKAICEIEEDKITQQAQDAENAIKAQQDNEALQKQQELLRQQQQMMAMMRGGGNPKPEPNDRDDKTPEPSDSAQIIHTPSPTQTQTQIQLKKITEKFKSDTDDNAQINSLKTTLISFHDNPESYTNESITDEQKAKLLNLKSITTLDELLKAIDTLEAPLKQEVLDALTIEAILKNESNEDISKEDRSWPTNTPETRTKDPHIKDHKINKTATKTTYLPLLKQSTNTCGIYAIFHAITLNDQASPPKSAEELRKSFLEFTKTVWSQVKTELKGANQTKDNPLAVFENMPDDQIKTILNNQKIKNSYPILENCQVITEETLAKEAMEKDEKITIIYRYSNPQDGQDEQDGHWVTLTHDTDDSSTPYKAANSTNSAPDETNPFTKLFELQSTGSRQSTV